MQLKRYAYPFALAVLATVLGGGQGLARPLIVCTEASPTSLNPGLSWSSTAADVGNQIYNRLVELERGGSNVVAGLADSYMVSDDGLVYTFNLRKGAKWHPIDGYTPSRDFNADDIVFTFSRYMDEKHPYHNVGNKNEYFEYLAFGKQITKLEKLDDYTVRMTLAAPNSTFLATLANEGISIQSAEYGDHLLKAGTPDLLDNQPVGTGPFQLVHYQKDAFVRFKRFADYWGTGDQAAKVDELVFAITPDATVRMTKIKAGECDIAPYPNPADVSDLLKTPDPAIELYKQPGIDYSLIGFNVTKKPFDDRRVREAVSLAIDRQKLLDAVYLGISGTAANSPIPPSLWGHSEIEPVPYDPERAKALLAEAGLPNGFKTTLWSMPVSRPYMPNSARAAEVLQQDLAKVGIEAEIVTFEWGEYLKRARAGEHDMILLGWILDYAHPNGAVDGQFNCASVTIAISRWCNEEFDKLFNEARQQTDQAKAIPLYDEMQKLLRREVPGYFIAHSVSYVPVRKEVVGFKKQSFGGQPYWGIELKE